MNDWQQRNESMKNGKLKTYLALKTNFGLEKYLTILNNFHYKRSICRLRISSHRLQIETGRYRNVPRDERICQQCSENEIEDEVHFLIKCSENKVVREQLFLLISQKCKN
jgi:superfamily II helicase